MSIQRDSVASIKLFDDLAAITLTTASTVIVKTTAVDTKDLSAFGFQLKGNRVLVPGAGDDELAFSFEESDTISGTYTAVPSEGTLPSRLAAPNNKLVVVVVGTLQPVGVFGTKRFVKLVLEGQPATADYIVTARPYGMSMFEEYTGYDPASVPGDLLP